MLSQVSHGSEILSKGPISHSLGVVPKAGGVASVRYVAAAEPDQPDNHRKRDREQRNDWSAFTEIVEKIENGEQGDQYGQERRRTRSEEHTSELQSLRHLVCRLLLEKKKKKY